MPAPPDDAPGARAGDARPAAEAGALEASRTDAEAPGRIAADGADPTGKDTAQSAGAARDEDDDRASGMEGGAAAEGNGGAGNAPAAEAAGRASADPDGAATAEPADEASKACDAGAARSATDPVGGAAEGEETVEHGERELAARAADDPAADPDAAEGMGEAARARALEPARGVVEAADARAMGMVRRTDGWHGSDAGDDPGDTAGAAAAPVECLPGADAPAAEAAAGEAPPPDPALFAHALRIAEALVFASDRPVTPARVQSALPPGCDARAVLTALAAACADRPAQLVEVAGGFAFRTAPELAPAITRVVEAPRRLPRAAMETLAIVAYHQPVTRAEIEEIRGASLSQSTLEALLEMALIAPRGRKEVPGRPSLWGTTPRFLEQFGLKSLNDLPRREELVNEPTLPLGPPPAAPLP